MSAPRADLSTGGRRQSLALALFLVLQVTAAVFFVGDALADFAAGPDEPHSLFEGLVAIALILSVVTGFFQLRHAVGRMRAQERALDTARGELARVIDAQFSGWGLTPAERDVGLLALKGLDVAEIADLRNAAHGTVRAQLTRIYAKAGVSGRAQFASWFVEDLLQPRDTDAARQP
ncbi:helix-turn-helix transcriptional regulator [Pelagovum pacificum]|uniref:Helix-turn-helix transcriptional regulator n=1 Tax=Pelagovum pacificum TaxID=2588711 RepID=A0A5C5GH26_9RHOB|nr:helix-turn-helix transcriptional regulator [Pelagovum pacificum]QQA43624.1 helix-turn-helix transcriptional regulator [Pelagovum pacificum]TNY33241.1 helix-turn-helix transcriptional regulator [Pelagovum pacificum]